MSEYWNKTILPENSLIEDAITNLSHSGLRIVLNVEAYQKLI